MKKNFNRAESYQRLKAQVLREIKLGKLDIAITMIQEGADSIQDEDLSDTLLFICHDYYKFERNNIRGLLHEEEKDVVQRKIIRRIVDLFKNYENMQSILQKIEK